MSAEHPDDIDDHGAQRAAFVELSMLRGLDQAQRGEFVADDFLDRLMEDVHERSLPDQA